jgi:hypothetical protein
LDPELSALIERGRAALEESGELRRPPLKSFRSTVPAETATVIRQWLYDGGYDQAVAQVALEDPDLATQ